MKLGVDTFRFIVAALCGPVIGRGSPASLDRDQFFALKIKKCVCGIRKLSLAGGGASKRGKLPGKLVMEQMADGFVLLAVKRRRTRT
jgi:ABC-type xylose transport system permease subunit